MLNNNKRKEIKFRRRKVIKIYFFENNYQPLFCSISRVANFHGKLDSEKQYEIQVSRRIFTFAFIFSFLSRIFIVHIFPEKNSLQFQY